MKPGLSETEKLAYAKRLGVPTRKTYDTDGNMLHEVLDSRILERERAMRERQSLWLVLISTVAAVAGAIAAWLIK